MEAMVAVRYMDSESKTLIGKSSGRITRIFFFFQSTEHWKTKVQHFLKIYFSVFQGDLIC